MQFNSNISDVFTGLAERVSSLSEPILREIAISMLPVVRDRIHTQGIASDGSQIGVYSEGYMSVRTGVYKSNEKVTKGKDKGKTRNVGVFTKGDHKGENRPRFNRNGDTKVILSLTRQMESDFSVQATETGYGLGYNNTLNFDKSQWAEANYKKPIFSLMDREKEMVIEIASTFTNNTLNG